jgi:hypothetical protein
MSWRMDKSLSLGMPMHPKKYPRGTSVKAWGCPRGTPFFIGKNQVTFQHTIFLLRHTLCVFLGASVVFSFQFCLVLFAAINSWTPTNFFWRSCLAFHLPRTLYFSLLSFNEYSLFLLLYLAFVFLPWFVFRSCYIFA